MITLLQKVGGKVGFRTGRMPDRTSIIAARPYLRDKTLHHEAWLVS